MSWISNLNQIYENCRDQIGVGTPGKDMLLPIYHITLQANVEITVDINGNYLNGRSRVMTDKEDMVTIVPCTEKSAGRTVKIVPHALSDNLAYVAGDYVKYGGESSKWGYPIYMENLEKWTEFPNAPDSLIAVYTYLKKGQLISDLINDGILFADNDGKGKLITKWNSDSEKPDIYRSVNGADGVYKTFVRFRVENFDMSAETRTWMDRRLWEHYIDYQNSLDGRRDYCYVMGKPMIMSEQAPRYIRRPGDGAKLISANDESNFTYKGRFRASEQAVGISRIVCEQSHNALKWLISKQGSCNGDQVVLAWNTEQVKAPKLMCDASDFLEEMLTQCGEEDLQPYDTAENYSKKLGKAINGYGKKLSLRENTVIMGLDSATPGRLSIFYYQELPGQQMLENLQFWHESCAWEHEYRSRIIGKDQKGKPIYEKYRFYGAPSPADIAKAAYGEKADEKIIKYASERILPCIVTRARFPIDIMNRAVERASRPESMESWEYQKTLGIACAIIRKVKNDKGDNWNMALDEKCTDRSYLFGRLLAYGEDVESYAMYSTGESPRQTNAERLMSRFAQKPASTWAIIDKQLISYWKRIESVKPGVAQIKKSEIDAILDFLGKDNFTDEKLDPVYLIGYASQKMEFRSHSSKKD